MRGSIRESELRGEFAEADPSSALPSARHLLPQGEKGSKSAIVEMGR
ncbi:hypothetical protein CDS [Bradyrhizobium sp.]|nr:hypothetical protein CDS [Bradyrhizobium sp.]